MSETKHTPGPWTWHGKGLEARNETVFIGSQRDVYVLPADAHLIAAAPELLEALQKCLSHMEMNPSLYRNRFGEWVPLVRECRAAVAKAEGR